MASRFDSLDKFLAALNPNDQLGVCADQRSCYTGVFPTLTDIRQVYGGNSAEVWLAAEITDLAVFCGCREKMDADQVSRTALLITDAYPYLKTSELMDFFRRFKLGMYGRFYGSVDPMIITSALRSWMTDRATFIQGFERQDEDAKEAEERKHFKPTSQKKIKEILEHHPILKQVMNNGKRD